MIRVENLTKVYDTITPIKDLSITINDGDVISIIGPSGTGKSTFLRCLNLLEEPTSGHIYYNDVEITNNPAQKQEIKKHMGMVFQSFNLFNHLTVLENVMAPQIDVLKRSKQEAYDKAVKLLKEVGLFDRVDSYPDELSGGQKQRVAIARTLAMDCEVILFDEPTSALDPTMVGEVQNVIKKLSRSGKTMLIVTHEMRFAKEVSTRVFYMDKGVVFEDGTPDQIFNNQKKDETRRFINHLSTLSFKVTTKTDDIASRFSSINSFSSKQSIDNNLKDRLISSYEELVANNLMSHIGTITYIDNSIEYNSEESKISYRIEYDGGKNNPLNNIDDPSIVLLNKNSEEITYRFDQDSNINVIKIKIR